MLPRLLVAVKIVSAAGMYMFINTVASSLKTSYQMLE